GPSVAPTGTTVLISVGLTVAKVAAVSWKLTAVALPKPVPETFTTVPGGPRSFRNRSIRGRTVKSVALCAEPERVTTAIGPVSAAAGTVARIEPFETTRKLARTPPSVTERTPTKLDPASVTGAPASPLPGENEVIAGGGGTTVNGLGLCATPPPETVTTRRPPTAASGTTARIDVGESTVG